VETDWRVHPRLRLVGGLRLDANERYGTWKAWLDPRGSAFLDVAPGTVLVAAAGIYSSFADPSQTSREWGNPQVSEQRGTHLSLGVRQDLPWSSKLEVTGFYKYLWDLVVQTAALDPDGRAIHVSNAGVGETIGLEVLARRELTHGLYGWLSYTYSRALRRDDPTAPGYPAWHYFQFDQTHVLALVLSLRLPREWIVGTRVRSVTGNPYTPNVGSVLNADSGRFQCIPGAPYSSRLGGFFQADARVDKRWVFDRWMFSAYLDVQNVSNAQNAEFRFPNYDCSQTVAIPSIPLFPTLGLRAEW
jgi:hypothetical protein